jgi:hypothetical protein
MIRSHRATTFAAMAFALGFAAGPSLPAQAPPDPNARKSDFTLPDAPKEKPLRTPGQAPSPTFQSTDSIKFTLRYRIVSQSIADPAWIDMPDQTTLPGQKVQIKLTGTNVVVLSELLPVALSPTTVRLKASNHIWLAQGQGELTYLTSTSTTVIDYGEEAFYYPLGSQSYDTGILQISIRMQLSKDENK